MMKNNLLKFFRRYWSQILLLAILAACVLGLVWTIWSVENGRTEFMAECLKYERQYECTAKWRRY